MTLLNYNNILNFSVFKVKNDSKNISYYLSIVCSLLNKLTLVLLK